MSDPLFFGYGSLVNLATHDYADPRPAVLHGWQRVWRQTDRRAVAYLSIEPVPGVNIAGVVAAVPGADWAALDAREAAYLRRDVTGQVACDRAKGPVAAYEVDPSEHDPARSHPILLSYLDVVVQGYLRLYGEAGVTAFFDTTAGWGTPIVDDRSAPRYPRHQSLTPEERRLTDAQLRRVS